MMGQFEVLTINGGRRYLTVVDTSRYDIMIGFRRILRELDPVEDPIIHTPWFQQREENHYNRSF